LFNDLTNTVVERHNWHKCSLVNLLISSDLYRVTSNTAVDL